MEQCSNTSYSYVHAGPHVSEKCPAHVVVSLTYTDMCVDMVAALYASCMTCVSTIGTLYVSGDRCTLFTIQDGRSPLMTASFHGCVDVVRVLIDAHADINRRQKVI